MARVICPSCGHERVLMDGKRKRCRKCGTPLTAGTAKPVKLKEVPLKPEHKQKPPRQIKSLKALAKAYPDLCAELAAHGAQEALDRIAAMSPEEFGQAFPELAEKLTNSPEPIETTAALMLAYPDLCAALMNSAVETISTDNSSQTKRKDES